MCEGRSSDNITLYTHIFKSHVYKGNLYLDLQGYRRTSPANTPPTDGNYGVYALDTESVSSKHI